MSRILIVDDEPAIGWSLRELLSDEGHDVVVAADVPTALEAAHQGRPDAILLDVRLGSGDGLVAVPDLREAAGPVPIVVMTAFGNLDTAVRAVQAGAFDYLTKPFDLERVVSVLRRAVAERPGDLKADQPAEAASELVLIGSSPPMQEIFKQIALVAGHDLPVLITGPTGTGKDVVARAIHVHGPRQPGPLVATNLAALAPGVVESELFGHTRGAFTGAVADRAGLFELANGGTIFLDEIGEAPADVQVKLLRVLETGGVTRVGEATPQIVNVRVIAATNRDLAQGVRAGTFREDLYHRLRVFPITMPALSERPGDIEPLARHFLARCVRGPQQTASSQAMSVEFLAALRDRDWPGNVRELKHAIEYAAVVARRGKLRPEHLPAPDRPGTSGTAAGIESAARGVAAAVKEWSAAARRELAALPEPDLHHRAIQLVEGTLLREALAHTGGNRTAAARLLGLDRATLRTKLRSLGIDD